VGAWVLAEHAHRAGSGRAQPLHALDGGGLAGAVRAQQAENLAALDFEGDVVDGDQVAAVDLAQMLDGDDGRHARERTLRRGAHAVGALVGPDRLEGAVGEHQIDDAPGVALGEASVSEVGRAQAT